VSGIAEEDAMSEADSYFERLTESASLIARHPDYPGKREVVERCADEVGELLRIGRITVAEGKSLLAILESGRGRRQAMPIR
jgi:hypothetical protein